MEIGGLLAGQEYDQLIGNHLLTVGGTLNVELIGGFSPAFGDSFDLFDGPMAGAFDSIGLPPLAAGLGWNTAALHSHGRITVVPEPATLSLLSIGGLVAMLLRLRRRRRR